MCALDGKYVVTESTYQNTMHYEENLTELKQEDHKKKVMIKFEIICIGLRNKG